MSASSLPSSDWGVYPTLFKIGNIPIDSYTTLLVLAFAVGGYIFYRETKQQKASSEKTLYILIAAVIGAAIGSKLPVWIFHYKEIISALPNITPLLSGRTVVGGLVGGTLAVMLLKSKLKIKEKRGNLFAPAAAIGLAIGRIGCFLRGCCYGIPTTLPWGVNFGDGVLRHPTQLYEAVFAFGMFIYLQKAKKKNPAPGALFRFFMISYFAFRFIIEFIRVEEKIWLGLSGFQWASLLILAYYALTSESVLKFIKKERFIK